MAAAEPDGQTPAERKPSRQQVIDIIKEQHFLKVASLAPTPAQ